MKLKLDELLKIINNEYNKGYDKGRAESVVEIANRYEHQIERLTKDYEDLKQAVIEHEKENQDYKYTFEKDDSMKDFINYVDKQKENRENRENREKKEST